MTDKKKLPKIDPAALEEMVPKLSSAADLAPGAAAASELTAPAPEPAAQPMDHPFEPPPTTLAAAVPAVETPQADTLAIEAPPATAPTIAVTPVWPATPVQTYAPVVPWHKNLMLRLSLLASVSFSLGYLAGRPFDQLTTDFEAAPPAAIVGAQLDAAMVAAQVEIAAMQRSGAQLQVALQGIADLMTTATLGDEFAARLGTLRPAMAGDAGGLGALDRLQPFANGAITLAGLRESFETSAELAMAAGLRPSPQGWVRRSWAWVWQLVKADQQFARATTIARARDALEGGAIVPAIDRLTDLDEAAAAKFSGWVEQARGRAGLDGALGEVAPALLAGAARILVGMPAAR